MTVVPLKPPKIAATPFRTVLVANRGEIALRIMATARSLGFGTVAVYSSADAKSRHVGYSDRAVMIGGPLPAESYLNIPAIIAAAKASGADAVHPGYGFLAENAAFARACREAGLVFIGPSAESIEAMGDKARAKAFMQAAGVPVVPGYQGEDQSEARFVAEAAKLGFPVMIKAVAGGGGRGMRLVPDAASLPALLASAQSEAKNAFGDATVLIEKAIVAPRHIEIQVFGDRHGNAIHVGERDCSIQRRHQKLIEEAPSPAVSPELRERMGEVSVKAVKALGYEGAGTLEFLLDRDGQFYFMEMNTRLQVEHRVSERLIGRDFVQWQLKIAAGEPLPDAQHEFYPHGHAIEIRLCAEDPARDFLPQSGRFHTWREYCGGYGVFVDTAMAAGADVSPYYDSMVAKVYAHAPTREEARTMLLGWLKEFTSLGVKTNQGFLQRTLSHPAFVAGNVTTAFIAEHGQALVDRAAADGLPDAALAAAILYDQQTPDRFSVERRHLGPPLPVPMILDVDGDRHEVAIHRERDGSYRIATSGTEFSVGIETAVPDLGADAPHFRYVLDGVARDIACFPHGTMLHIQRGADQVHVRDLTRAATKPAGSDGSDGRLTAAMNGRIVAVHAAVGDAVSAGQPLVTLEAMKMEHVHTAPIGGKLVEIAVTPGEQVTTGRLMAAIEKTDAA